MENFRINLPYLYKLYQEINREAFDSKLPSVLLEIGKATRQLGSFRYPMTVKGSRADNIHLCRIRISRAYARSAEDYRDTLAHEMIHFHIWLAGIREPQHGPTFTGLMNELNARCGYNISVKATDVAPVKRERLTRKFIVVVDWKDGMKTISRVTSTFVFEFHRILLANENVVRQEWFGSFDEWFDHFPAARTPRFFKLSQEDYESYVATAVPLEFADGYLKPKS